MRAALPFALMVASGAFVIGAIVEMQLADCWSASFPSAGHVRALGIMGLLSAAAAVILAYRAGSRTSGGGLAAAVVAFVVYWLNGGELVPRLLAAGVAYLVVSYAVASVVRARGALVGFGKRSVRAAELYARGWDSAKDRYRNRYAPFRPVTAGVTPAPATALLASAGE